MKTQGFKDTLSVNTINNKTWVLTAPLTFQSKTNGSITVPEGFTTDLASVPRLLWWFLSPWDVARSAVIHDFMYSNSSEYGRKEADKMFLEAMRFSDPHVIGLKRRLAYISTRLFGGSYYK